MDRDEYEHYQRRIDLLEKQNKQLLDQLISYDIVTPRVIHVENVSKDSIDRLLQQENTQLKAELQALRELLKEIEVQNQFCTICGTWEGHKEGCVLKAELDKIGGDE